mgnify:CR=1 FL=1
MECKQKLLELISCAADDMRKPVLLITDMGASVDDAITLFILQATPAIDLVGVVTTGGSEQKRARQTQAWLRKLGAKDLITKANYSSKNENHYFCVLVVDFILLFKREGCLGN